MVGKEEELDGSLGNSGGRSIRKRKVYAVTAVSKAEKCMPRSERVLIPINRVLQSNEQDDVLNGLGERGMVC